MGRSLARPSCWAFCIFLLFATSGFGALGATTSLKLVNANASYVMGGVYTSPYSISINGGAPTLMICDDFLTNVSIGQTWNSQTTTLADLQAGTNPAGTPKFGDVSKDATVSKYATAAVLAAQLMSLGSFANETAGEISYAIWGVFDPDLLAHNPSSGEGHLTATQLAAAQNFLADAQAVVSAATTVAGVDLSKIPYMTIYTPDPLKASQEFLRVSMPEPSFIGMLVLDLVGIVGFVLFLRRRMAREG